MGLEKILHKHGSPPRVWGRRNAMLCLCLATRFTPTRVGKTTAVQVTLATTAVHPHACGEDCTGPAGGGLSCGSPPRVWGRPLYHAPAAWDCRFTPTRVGKTRDALLSAASFAVHPHACGEDAVADNAVAPGAGSPPRVWGRQSWPAGASRWGRFTPTRVGKTLWHNAVGQGHMVHPHACGEDRGRPVRSLAHPGSPPRVWGRRFVRGTEARRVRFTPTRVGKTIRPGRHWRQGAGFTPTRVGKTAKVGNSTRFNPVHPHACGEDSIVSISAALLYGSPPRVWGRLDGCPSRLSLRRFTPTRVGKTLAVRCHHVMAAVHPHACGEDRQVLLRLSVDVGSPPRVWGRLRVSVTTVREDRFTPTRVGKTCVPRSWSVRNTVHPHACGEDTGTARWYRRS